MTLNNIHTHACNSLQAAPPRKITFSFHSGGLGGVGGVRPVSSSSPQTRGNVKSYSLSLETLGNPTWRAGAAVSPDLHPVWQHSPAQVSLCVRRSRRAVFRRRHENKGKSLRTYWGVLWSQSAAASGQWHHDWRLCGDQYVGYHFKFRNTSFSSSFGLFSSISTYTCVTLTGADASAENTSPPSTVSRWTNPEAEIMGFVLCCCELFSSVPQIMCEKNVWMSEQETR